MLRNLLLPTILLTSLAAFSAPGQGSQFIHWHSNNLQLLRGYDYKVGAQQRTIVTYEHANRWGYGDFFMFVDMIRPDQGSNTYYSEFSPRFSLSKIGKRDFTAGVIKDIFISTTLEKPKDQSTRYLYGAAANLDLSGFSFFNTNLYVRDNPDLEGRTWQLTLSWKRPFRIGAISYVSEGFADFSGSEGNNKSNQLIVPRLLMDAGELTNNRANRFWLGVEYSYWHNKFGIAGVTESVLQLQGKWVF